MKHLNYPEIPSSIPARAVAFTALQSFLAVAALVLTGCGPIADLPEDPPPALTESADDSSREEARHEIGSYAVESDGSTVYLGSGRDLIVLVRDGVGNPRPVSRLRLAGVIRDLDLDGNVLAAACGEGGMVLVEVSRPEEPRILAAERLADPAEGVALQGSRVMVAARSAGVSLFDISVPGTLRLLGRYETEEPALRLAVEGRLLYVAASFGGMRVLDVSDPANVREIGFANRGAYDMGTAVDVAVSGSYGYVANREIGLRVLDIARPEEPTTRSIFPLLHAPSALAAMETVVLVADQDNGLQLIDAADPLRPKPLASVALPGRAVALAVADRFAYVAVGEGGLWVVDLEEPRKPVLAGSYLIGQEAVALAGLDHGFLVVDALQGIRCFSAAGSGLPEEQAAIPSLGAPAVMVGGRYLVSSNREGLAIVDLADPASPVAKASVPLEAQPGSLAAFGERALLVGSDIGLQVFQLEDPSRPRLIAQLPIDEVCYPQKSRDTGFASPVFTSTIWGLTAHSGGWIAACDRGISDLDLSDSAHPKVRSFLALPERVLHAEVAEGTAYLSCDDGLRIVDLSAEEGPVEIGRFRSPGFLRKSVLRDDRLFMIDLNAGLIILDVANPAQPREISRCTLPGRPVDLWVAGTLVLVAAGEAGVLTVDVAEPLHPRLLQSPGS